jgi:pantoate--beta-alanine ligase
MALIPLITIADMKEYTLATRGKTIGFVPTMGCLHTGHLSLVKQCVAENDITVVSIFVNPTQFGENEDFDKYPRVLDKDLELLSKYDVDVVFCPEYSEIYPKDYKTFVDVLDLNKLYCGDSRPDHFRGVATIVCKLLNIVNPDNMYMGEKDFQQIIVLEKMILDLNMLTTIRRCPVVREEDGLAMSSRNIYLNIDARKRALCLHKALLLARDLFKNGETRIDVVRDEMMELIHSLNLPLLSPNMKEEDMEHKNRGDYSIDYISFVNNDTFEEEQLITKNTRLLIAVKIGNTRLIDNLKICP